MKKIDRDGLLLCELQATAFENSIDKMDSSSETFIRRFMKSNIAKRMDDESILESNLQANDILQLVDEEYGVSHYGTVNILIMRCTGLDTFIDILQLSTNSHQHEFIKS